MNDKEERYINVMLIIAIITFLILAIGIIKAGGIE